MNDNKNIPDANQSWLAAEKMLDRHFRTRKLIRIAASIVVPAIIIGFAFWFSNHKNETAIKHTSDNQGQVANNSNPITNSINLNEEKSLSHSSDKTNIDANASANQNNNINLNKDNTNFTQSPGQKPSLSVKSNKENSISPAPASKNNSGLMASKSSSLYNEKMPVDESISSNRNTSKTKSSINSVSKATASASGISTINLPSNSPSISLAGHKKEGSQSLSGKKHKSILQSKNNKVFGSSKDNSFNSNLEPIEIYPAVASVEQISLLRNYEGEILVPSGQLETNERSWPKPFMQTPSQNHISWEASVYVGAHSINKRIQGSNDWQSHLNQRKNEENSIITPSIGLSVSATKKLFTLSMGVEFSTYGEKTNYYPYSLKDSITSNSSWQTFISNYTDTDTAYITGNPYFMQTILQRQDSAIVISQDTIETSQYDKLIAERNGINRIFYLELPIELSICFSKGKAGFGVSGGISPALLVSQKGNYLRRDGRGLESFSEIKTFRKIMVNARFSADFYYRFSGRAKLLIRPQIKSNLNSVFENSYGVKQKYYSTGVLFGISYMIN
jgi:hypothetical protein